MFSFHLIYRLFLCLPLTGQYHHYSHRYHLLLQEILLRFSCFLTLPLRYFRKKYAERETHITHFNSASGNFLSPCFTVFLQVPLTIYRKRCARKGSTFHLLSQSDCAFMVYKKKEKSGSSHLYQTLYTWQTYFEYFRLSISSCDVFSFSVFYGS